MLVAAPGGVWNSELAMDRHDFGTAFLRRER
jgi:hypothetical protein